MRWRVGVELTATERCAVIRLTLPPHRRAWLLLDDPTSMAPGGSFATSFTFSHGGSDRLLTGYTTSNCGGVPEGFKGFFAVEADAPFVHTGFFTAEGVVELGRTKERTAQRLGAVVGFGASETERVVTIRVATSFIGAAQALANMRQETGTTKGYEEIQHESREIWEQWLGRVEVRGRAKRDRRTFYTSLYRALLFPRKFHELDAECKPFHYNPYSGGCHPGVLYTDNGFWDTHRTVYPFLALVYPTQCAEIMQGWVNAAKFGKRWFPKWASPGYRSMMVGTHSDVVVADTHLRGIPFDVELAYSLSRRNGLEPGDPQGAYGREGLEDYASLGFVPSDRFEHAVCRTNDYAYDDFGLAQLARVLGKEEDFALFGRRALNYRNMFDPNIGFMRGRNADGSWREPFSEFTWGGDYVEGSAWQHVFAVPHDPAGLVQLFGGEDKFCEKLDQMLALPPYFDIGTYWTDPRDDRDGGGEVWAVRAQQSAGPPRPVPLCLREAALEDGILGQKGHGRAVRPGARWPGRRRGQWGDVMLVPSQLPRALSALPRPPFLRVWQPLLRAGDHSSRIWGNPGDPLSGKRGSCQCLRAADCPQWGRHHQQILVAPHRGSSRRRPGVHDGAGAQ